MLINEIARGRIGTAASGLPVRHSTTTSLKSQTRCAGQRYPTRVLRHAKRCWPSFLRSHIYIYISTRGLHTSTKVVLVLAEKIDKPQTFRGVPVYIAAAQRSGWDSAVRHICPVEFQHRPGAWGAPVDRPSHTQPATLHMNLLEAPLTHPIWT